MDFHSKLYLATHMYIKPTELFNQNNTQISQALSSIGLSITHLYTTDNDVTKYVYLDFYNNIYLTFELIPNEEILCQYITKILSSLEPLKFGKRCTQLRQEHNNIWVEMLVPTVLRMYVFEQIYQAISENERFDVWYAIYQSLDIAIGLCDRQIADSVLKFKLQTQVIDNPDELITIYHGEDNTTADIQTEISWTTDYDVAEFFATRFNKEKDNNTDSVIYQAQIKRKNAIITDSHEAEVLCFYNDLQNIKIINN